MLYKTQTLLKDGKPIQQSGNAIVGFRNSLQLAYNADHELTQSISITQQGIDTTVITTDYHYDAFGRRTHKHSETKHKSRKHYSGKLLINPVQTQKTKQQHTSYLWDGNRQLQQNTATHTHTIIYEQDSFEPVAQFIWLRDGLTAANDEPKTNDEGWYGNNKPVIKTGVQLYHYHNDHLGTPNELTDQQGDVVWYADYEAWGNTAKVVWREQVIDNVKVSQDELQPIRFQGQSFDTETGLHYNRFRYFDPDLGMFTTRDPIGLMGGTNVFQYAPNPTGWIDPFGLSKFDPVTFPDSQVISDVHIQMQGSRGEDFRVANAKQQFNGDSGRPTQQAHKGLGDVVWHHADYDPATNTARMQLVTTADHKAKIPHSGSVSMFDEFTEKVYGSRVKYGSAEAIRRANELNKSCTL